MNGFVIEVKMLLEELEGIKGVARRIIDDLRRGEEPDLGFVQRIFDIYYKLVVKSADIHRTYVLETYLLTEEGPYETVEEIALKLLELSKEYEKITNKFMKASREEKIELMKSLINTINKYTSEIETLFVKLEEEARAEEIFEL